MFRSNHLSAKFILLLSFLLLGQEVQAMPCSDWLKQYTYSDGSWVIESNGCPRVPYCEDDVPPGPDDACVVSGGAIKCPTSKNAKQMYRKFRAKEQEVYQGLSVVATLPKPITIDKLVALGAGWEDWIFHHFKSDFKIKATQNGVEVELTGVQAYQQARGLEFNQACPDASNSPGLAQPGLQKFYNSYYHPNVKGKALGSPSSVGKAKAIRSSSFEGALCLGFPTACNVLKQLSNAFRNHSKVDLSDINSLVLSTTKAMDAGYMPNERAAFNRKIKSVETRHDLRAAQRLALGLNFLAMIGQSNGASVWADFNGDAQRDFAALSNSGKIEVYLKGVDKVYRLSDTLHPSLGQVVLAVSDFNHDGKIDIVAQSQTDLIQLEYFKGLGNGKFERISGDPCGDLNQNGIRDCDEGNCNGPSCNSGGLGANLASLGFIAALGNDNGMSPYTVANQLKVTFAEFNGSNPAPIDLVKPSTEQPAPRQNVVYSSAGRLVCEQNISDWELRCGSSRPQAETSFMLTFSLAKPPSGRLVANRYDLSVSLGIERALEFRQTFFLGIDEAVICKVAISPISHIWGASCNQVRVGP